MSTDTNTPRTDGDLNVLWNKPGITIGGPETDPVTPIPETPLTDAEASDGWSGDAVCVSVEFAQKLETKLQAAQAEVARLKESYLKSQSLAAAMLAKSSDELTALRARVADLEAERNEWSAIYKRDYGHNWDGRGSYKGF